MCTFTHTLILQGAQKWRLIMDNKDYRKLFKSNTNRMLCGICGGIGEYFRIDPTLVRILWVVFCMCGGSGVIAYIIAAIIIPEQTY